MSETYHFPDSGIIPACRYCGQIVQDDGNHDPFQTQAEAEEWAARHCDCISAKNYKMDCEAKERRQKRLQEARDRLEELLADQIDAETVSEDTVEHLFGIITSVYDEYLVSISVKVDNLNRISIRKDADGNVELSNRETRTQKYHI